MIPHAGVESKLNKHDTGKKRIKKGTQLHERLFADRAEGLAFGREKRYSESIEEQALRIEL